MSHIFSRAAALLLALLVSACAGAPPASPTATTAPVATPAPTAAPVAEALTITDASGRTVTVPAAPERLISLAPNATEILYAIGAGDRLLAVDAFSDYPPEVDSLPEIGGLDYTYNIEAIVAQTPDIVFAAGITAPETIAQLEQLGLAVVVLGPLETSFDTILGDIELAGQIVGREEEASALVAQLQARLADIAERAAGAPEKPRVYWELDATDPTKPYSVGPGSFVDEMITRAGGINIFAAVDTPYPQVSAEQVVAGDPEIIIMSNAAYGTTVESLMARPGWDVITAVRDGRVFPIDDNLVSRPGPRVVDGLDAAARLIHPDVFGAD